MAWSIDSPKVVSKAPPMAGSGVSRPVRCPCNRLVCMVEGDEVAIKCSRCKRIIRIRTRGIVDVRVGED